MNQQVVSGWMVWGALASVVLGADGDVQSWTFEADEPGAIAKGFLGEVGRWEVVATSEGRVLAQKAENPDATFNVALVSGSSAKDLDLSVRLKAVEGKDDRGGGLVWRAKDSRNYYIARYNPLEDNFRVYKVVDGVRTMFQDAKAPKGDGWRSIRVVMQGDRIECYLDGMKLLEVRDSTFVEAGKVGVWSKADARSYFDDLTLRPLAGSAGKNPSRVAGAGDPGHSVAVAFDGPIEPSGGGVEVDRGALGIAVGAVSPRAVEGVEDPDQRGDLWALPAAVFLEHRLGGALPVGEAQATDHDGNLFSQKLANNLGTWMVFGLDGRILRN